MLCVRNESRSESVPLTLHEVWVTSHPNCILSKCINSFWQLGWILILPENGWWKWWCRDYPPYSKLRDFNSSLHAAKCRSLSSKKLCKFFFIIRHLTFKYLLELWIKPRWNLITTYLLTARLRWRLLLLFLLLMLLLSLA